MTIYRKLHLYILTVFVIVHRLIKIHHQIDSQCNWSYILVFIPKKDPRRIELTIFLLFVSGPIYTGGIKELI